MDQLYAAILSLLSILLISILCFKSFTNTTTTTTTTHPLPPGPRGLPILGYLPFLGNNLLQDFTHLAHKYGPIFKLYLGNKLCVVISSPSLVKEIVRGQDAVFAHRDAHIAARVSTYGAIDIAWSPPNSQWRKMRKLFVQEMMSNPSLEATYALRKDEVRKAIRQVHAIAKAGEPVEIADLSFRTELNVMMNMLWGGSIEGGDGERIAAEFRVVVVKLINLLAKPNISDFYPVLAGLDIQGVKKEMEGYVQSVDKIFDAVIAERKKKLSGEIRKEGKKDFLQILLEFEGKQDDSELSITLTQIKAMLMDIVAGGTDTTATTIEWAMAELMNNPEAMIKAQKELSDVVGLDNMIEEFHMPKFKYLEAVIKETLRMHSAIPLLVPRSPSETSTVGGYMIPKNTRVFLNVWSIQRDPSIWDSPTEFRPERFVDDENKKWDFKGNNFEYLPFGSGRRVCPGLPLAERMLIYLLASLLHSFDWKLAQGETLDLSETFGIVLRKTKPLFAIPNPRLSDSSLYLY